MASMPMTARMRIEAPVRGVLYHSREVKGTGDELRARVARCSGKRKPIAFERAKAKQSTIGKSFVGNGPEPSCTLDPSLHRCRGSSSRGANGSEPRRRWSGAQGPSPFEGRYTQAPG